MKRTALMIGASLALATVGIWSVLPRTQGYIDERLGSFRPDVLSEHGWRAYEGLLEAEIVDAFRSTFERPEATDRLLSLWDEPAPAATQALLALCEYGTPAARFYGLAGLNESDPWTFERAYQRYGRDPAHLRMVLGCLGDSGSVGELVERHVLEGKLADRWRAVWSRTERTGPGLARALKRAAR